MNKKPTRKNLPVNVAPGAFPYPLTGGAKESRYLTWVRNHSNYMATRGFLDYMRIAAVLVRGILVNFLSLLPWLLLAAVFLGWAYGDTLKDWGEPYTFFLTKAVCTEGWVLAVHRVLGTTPPYLFTPVVAGLALLWVVMFPVVSRLYMIVSHRKTQKTGSSSSVKVRDRFERTFGGLLFAIIVVALIESLPLLLYFFHHKVAQGPGMAVALLAMVLVLAASSKILAALGGAKKKLAVLLIGLIGLFIPLMVVLQVAEFVVYGKVAGGSAYVGLLYLLPVAVALAIVLAMLAGLVARTLKGWEYPRLLGLLVLTVLLFAFVIVMVLIDKSATFVLAWAVEIWFFCWLAVDVNRTSVHGLYRDRLASAYLVGRDTQGDVDIERDLDLADICRYDAGSTAPYHIVNVALNLQGSGDPDIRERNSDFFIFSKRFIGSDRTGYCRSETMEQVYPQINLASAMAISAAAASPNMGRGTNPALVAFMTLLNVRLGFWIPNPGRLEERTGGRTWPPESGASQEGPGFGEQEVLAIERDEIKARRANAYKTDERRPEDGLVGIGFSGGGIRSATINLGIAQALDRSGAFRHVDYMSTVSGGGYLGSSISTLMRHSKENEPALSRVEAQSEIAGTVRITKHARGEHSVKIQGTDGFRDYGRFTRFDELNVRDGKAVKAKEFLLKRHDSLLERFHWRVRPAAFFREMRGALDGVHRWVNLSDGGHIENLAGIELLRRRCKYIILGDGEADPNLHFNGLATLIRFARIDLGIAIDINLDALRLRSKEDPRSRGHWVIGTITYPPAGDKGAEQGLLLYLKSSFTGDEDEVVQEYRHKSPTFPHESTADQFFDEGQFEAYRALGEHIAKGALRVDAKGKMSRTEFDRWYDARDADRMSFEDLKGWFEALARTKDQSREGEESSRTSPTNKS